MGLLPRLCLPTFGNFARLADRSDKLSLLRSPLSARQRSGRRDTDVSPVSQAFLAQLHAKYQVWSGVKSPTQKRRLKRRLEERKQRKDGLPVEPRAAPVTPTSQPTPNGSPNTFADQPCKSHEERKVIRATRYRKRLNRKLKERQRMARRSGLPELVCRSGGRPASAEAARTTSSTKAVGSRSNTLPTKSDDCLAEETPELSSDSKQVLRLDDDRDFELDRSSKWRDALDPCPVAKRLETKLYWERRKAWPGRGWGAPDPSLSAESTD